MVSQSIEIHNELAEMSEWQRLISIPQFQLSLSIFQRNAYELTRLLNSFQTGPAAMKLWALHNNNRPLLALFRDEVARLLQNFEGSSKSLVDHANYFYRNNYRENGHFKEYEEEIKMRFEENPVVQFVHGLRNYLIHKKAPSIFTTLFFESGKKPINLVLLAKEELLKSGVLNRHAKKYLHESSQEIDLLEVVSQYVSQVNQFYYWMFSRIQTVHSADFMAVKNKQIELQKAMGDSAPRILDAYVKTLEQIQSRQEGISHEIFGPENLKLICDSMPNLIECAIAYLNKGK